MNRGIGVVVIFAGLALLILGLLIYSGALFWFGRLPGDLRYESDNVRIHIPIVSMLLISLALSLVVFIVRRFL